MDQLPSDCLNEIFKHLNYLNLCKSRRVCTRWNGLIKQGMTGELRKMQHELCELAGWKYSEMAVLTNYLISGIIDISKIINNITDNRRYIKYNVKADFHSVIGRILRYYGNRIVYKLLKTILLYSGVSLYKILNITFNIKKYPDVNDIYSIMKYIQRANTRGYGRRRVTTLVLIVMLLLFSNHSVTNVI